MRQRSAWTGAVVIGAVLIVSMTGAAHNFLGVYDAALSIAEGGGSQSESVNSLHCDGILTDPVLCVEPIGQAEATPFHGFAFLDGRDDFLVHTTCEYEIREPNTDTQVKTEIWSETYFDSDFPTCSAIVHAGESFVQTESSHEPITAPDDPNIVFAEPIHAKTTLTDGSGSISDELLWFQNWIKDAPMRTAATIDDPSAEDEYLDIRENASEYVIADSSGDDTLWIDGVKVAVTDGVPVSTGDVKITRTDASEGKNWTIEHVEDLPFAARIQPVDDSRETRVKTFQV